MSDTGRIYPKLSEEERDRLLKEFKALQDGGLIQPRAEYPSFTDEKKTECGHKNQVAP